MKPPDQSTVAASWLTPSWASFSRPDEECVVHRREVGAIPLSELGGRDVKVEVIQRDEMEIARGAVTFHRANAYIFAAENDFIPEEARAFAQLLISAAEMIELSKPTDEQS